MTELRRLLFNEATKKLELLTAPVCRLELDLRQSPLQMHVNRHMARLKRRGIRLRPLFYMGEDWGCVTGTANIEVGFYDADPLLRRLNKEARGWAHDAWTIDYLLRHETGHAFCYAHRLYKEPEFRTVFSVKGSFYDTYPSTDRYKPRPWSRDFVNPNLDHYAQKHPDDDFAETFSVWLDPRSNWRQVYRNKRGALRKLGFVSELVERYGRAAPAMPLNPAERDSPVESIKRTVGEVLGTSLVKYRRRATGYIDPLLRRIGRFRPNPSPSGMIPLAEVVAAHSRPIAEALVKNAGVTPAQAATLLHKMQQRANALHLHVRVSTMDVAVIKLTSMASSLASRFALTGSLFEKA
ncbi:MAG: hypothetical protein AB1714_17600 [Acidobacteriota bacterium]